MLKLQLVPQGGRYPYRTIAYDSKQITATLTVDIDAVHLRIDDAAAEDRWEEFTIPAVMLRNAFEANAPTTSE